jgi:hypothetical protein
MDDRADGLARIGVTAGGVSLAGNSEGKALLLRATSGRAKGSSGRHAPSPSANANDLT